MGDANNIRETIMQKLRETEATNSVKIPIAVESGSRGWGFASPDSDYDCRFIYVHKKDWYFTAFEKPDVIEYAADKVFDINGWDLRKVISNIAKSNATIFEWLSSNEVYVRDDGVLRLFGELAEAFFNPVSVSYHYLNLAKKKLEEITESDSARLKTYFYVLRPLANVKYIEEYGKMPYMEYFKTLGAIETEKAVASEIERLSELKKTANEGFTIPPSSILLSYFSREAARQTERLKMCCLLSAVIMSGLMMCSGR